MSTNGGTDAEDAATAGDASAPEDQWFDNAEAIDPEWVQYDVTTPKGKQVSYRIPRRTLFETIDA